MPIEPIDIRLGNYFEYNRRVLELKEYHFKRLIELLPVLKPISLNGRRLARLNFSYTAHPNRRQHMYTQYVNGLDFTLISTLSNGYVLYINQKVKLMHIKHVHQLQNVFYDLTGQPLRRAEPSTKPIR